MNLQQIQGLLFKMHIKYLSKILFSLVIFHSWDLSANILYFDIPQKKIELKDENSNEPDFIVYVYSDSMSSLVLKITGPKQKVILQKKKKILGMWTWNKTGEFSYPSFFHYYTNKKNEEIDFEIKKDLVDNIILIGKDDDNLKKELIEKQLSTNLFKVTNNSFKELNKKTPEFFKIPIKLPYNAPAGDYFVSLSLMKIGSKIETEKVKIIVQKPGISSFIFKFAHKFSFLYGIFSAIIAVGLGLAAGIFFRKN